MRFFDGNGAGLTLSVLVDLQSGGPAFPARPHFLEPQTKPAPAAFPELCRGYPSRNHSQGLNPKQPPLGCRLIFLILSCPRATIFNASSGNGRCSAFASSHGVRIHGRQDNRHRLVMDLFNDCVRRGRQESVDEVRAGDRF